VKPVRSTSPDLEHLVKLFYDSPGDLGEFQEVKSHEMPAVFQKLLAHDEHMTVAVEAHHGTPVDVNVLETYVTPTHYSRKILLRRQTDREVVQFGIVRLNLHFLDPEVRQQIEQGRIPLGRVLIEHNVLRNVRLLSLWKVTPGTELLNLFGMEKPDTCYGRTALIYCNGVPAVELLEVVTPS
jgi:chorismate-pyruvate lyase